MQPTISNDLQQQQQCTAQEREKDGGKKQKRLRIEFQGQYLFYIEIC